MIRSYCGFGDADDPEHRRICLTCERGYWREQHPNLFTLQTVTWTLILILFVFCFLYIGYDYVQAIRGW